MTKKLKRRSIGNKFGGGGGGVSLSSPIRRGSPVKSTRRRSGLLVTSAAAANAIDAAAGGPGGGGPPSSSNIRVSVRVRPQNEREANGEGRTIIDVVDDRMLVFDPKSGDDGFFFHGKKQSRRDLNKKVERDHKFAFDRVFGPESTNEEVFQGTTSGLIQTLFNGYNCSVFVYGATGAGKTFTMLGSKDNPGITYRTVVALYDRIEEMKETLSCEVAVSYLEIYNETVVDLINPGGLTLNVREDGKNGVNIPGLTRHKPSTPQDLLKLLQYGNSNRTQHPTDANAESSRSHAVFQVFLKQQDKNAGLSADVKVAKLSMIDLAGSERGTATSSRGASRLREGANINKSLLALGNCINALAEGSKYIPYRNSKLTRMLKDSIGGNCQTVMISNISPSSQTYEDTYNTLKYADRAKKIKVKLRKNVVSVDFHVAQYAKIVQDLKGEIMTLKEKLTKMEEENEALRNQINDDDIESSTNREAAPSEPMNDIEKDALLNKLMELEERQKDYDRLQERIRQFEATGESSSASETRLNNQEDEDDELSLVHDKCKEYLIRFSECTSNIKLTDVKILHLEKLLERIEIIGTILPNNENTVSKVNNAITNLKAKMKDYENTKIEVKAKLKEYNSKWRSVISHQGSSRNSSYRTRAFKSELDALKARLNYEHIVDFSTQLTIENRSLKNLFNESLTYLTSSHYQLIGYGATNDSKIKDFALRACGGKVTFDEKLTATNLDSKSELLGADYSTAVDLEISSCNESMTVQTNPITTTCLYNQEETIDETPEKELDNLNYEGQEDDVPPQPARPPTPPRHLRLSVSPPKPCATIDDNSSQLKPNIQINEATQLDSTMDLPPKPSLSHRLSTNKMEEEEEKEKVDDELNSTQVIETQQSNLPVINVTLDSTQTLESPKSSISILAGVNLDSTHVIDKPEDDDDDGQVISNNLNSTQVLGSPTQSDLPAILSTDLNSTHVIESPKLSAKTPSVESPSSNSIRRETFQIIKPTVAVQPFTNKSPSPLKPLSASSKTVRRTLNKPSSRTPPPHSSSGTASSSASLAAANARRRMLKSSVSTSRLLTASDLRLGGNNVKSNSGFKRPVDGGMVSSSSAPSAPSYMQATCSFSNRHHKKNGLSKENNAPTPTTTATGATTTSLRFSAQKSANGATSKGMRRQMSVSTVPFKSSTNNTPSTSQ